VSKDGAPINIVAQISGFKKLKVEGGGSAAYVKCPKCGKEVLDSCIDPDGLGCYACIRGGIPGAVKDRIEAGA
jgi:hypothetical protein